ncbi:MAG: alpha/beta hydrolase [Candidatus Micrarchaeota archaeon]
MELATVGRSRLKRDRIAAPGGVLVEYAYADNMKPRTIAFVNGWGTTSYSEWAKQLRIREHNLLFFNNRGMGNTGLGDGPYLRSCAGDLAMICARMGIAEIDLVGHSMGGLIAALFFSEFRQSVAVRSMTFVSSPDGDPLAAFPYRRLLPPAAVDRMTESLEDGVLSDIAHIIERRRMFEKLAYAATRGIGVNVEERVFSALYHNFLSRRKAVAIALNDMREHGKAIGEGMRQIDVPALIVHGRNDFFVSPEAARRMHERINGSRLCFMDRSTHAPMFEQPSLFNSMLLSFLAECGPAGAAAEGSGINNI